MRIRQEIQKVLRSQLNRGRRMTLTLEPMVRALQALRGVDLIVAVTFATEIGDVRRFENSRQLWAISD